MNLSSTHLCSVVVIAMLAQQALAQPGVDMAEVGETPSSNLPLMLPPSSPLGWSAGVVPTNLMTADLQRSQTRPDSDEPRESGHFRPALVASAGLAATGALLAYWSTNEAEQAYKRYLHSAGASRQQDALDSSERHDRIAGVGFLLMEAGLVLTARFVFF
jgi:hypothetical protein